MHGRFAELLSGVLPRIGMPDACADKHHAFLAVHGWQRQAGGALQVDLSGAGRRTSVGSRHHRSSHRAPRDGQAPGLPNRRQSRPVVERNSVRKTPKSGGAQIVGQRSSEYSLTSAFQRTGRPKKFGILHGRRFSSRRLDRSRPYAAGRAIRYSPFKVHRKMTPVPPARFELTGRQ